MRLSDGWMLFASPISLALVLSLAMGILIVELMDYAIQGHFATGCGYNYDTITMPSISGIWGDVVRIGGVVPHNDVFDYIVMGLLGLMLLSIPALLLVIVLNPE